MWRALVAMSAWMLCAEAYAKPVYVPPLLPPLVLTPPSYEAPPTTLALPTDSSRAAVEQARGNVARWRDAERLRLGRYIRARSNGVAAQRVIPRVGGYFALFSDATARPGIVYGYWSDPSSTVGSPSLVRDLTFVAPYQVCEGQLPWAGDADLNDVAYLGNVWRPEFEALDASLGAPELRTVTGPSLTDGTALRVQQANLDLSRFYPQRAVDHQIRASVLVGCRVQEDLNLLCGVIGVDVQPPSFAPDFGRAALHMFSAGRPRALDTTTNGEPAVGVCVRRTIRFAIPP